MNVLCHRLDTFRRSCVRCGHVALFGQLPALFGRMVSGLGRSSKCLCVSCVPNRGGRSHKNQKLAWTRTRLNQWLGGERAELWHDLPSYKRPSDKTLSDEAATIQKQNRCITLCGGWLGQRFWSVGQTATPRLFAGNHGPSRAKAPSRRSPCGLELF